MRKSVLVSLAVLFFSTGVFAAEGTGSKSSSKKEMQTMNKSTSKKEVQTVDYALNKAMDKEKVCLKGTFSSQGMGSQLLFQDSTGSISATLAAGLKVVNGDMVKIEALIQKKPGAKAQLMVTSVKPPKMDKKAPMKK